MGLVEKGTREMNYQHPREAKQAAQKLLKKLGKRWMVAVWRVKDGTLYFNRTTWRFPKEDHQNAVRHLQDALNKIEREHSR